MVLVVIAMHSSMTYMEYGPPWWYVINDQKSLYFTFLVVFFDSFPMSVLFFLAGYFAFPSFDRKGPALFLKEKSLRLGVPWILGVVLVAPFLARSSMIALGYPRPDMFTFMTRYFPGPFYQQGPYWFLGVLFFFMVIFAVAATIGRKTKVREKTNNKKARPWVILTALWAVSVLTYYLSGRYVMPAVDWLSIGYVLYFQPARIVGYLLMFMLGLYGWRTGWFTGNGWSPNTMTWGTIAVVSAIFLLGIKFFIAPFLGEVFDLVSEAFSYNTAMLSKTIFLMAFFLNTPKFPCVFTKSFEADTFGLYWLHMVILMPVLYVLKMVDLPIVVKWTFSILVTVAVGVFVLRCGRYLKKFIFARVKQ